MPPSFTKFMKFNKSNTAFLHEIIIIFSPLYILKTTVITSFNQSAELKELKADPMIFPWIYRSRLGKTIHIAFTNSADCPNRFSFDWHPCTSKFLILPNQNNSPFFICKNLFGDCFIISLKKMLKKTIVYCARLQLFWGLLS